MKNERGGSKDDVARRVSPERAGGRALEEAGTNGSALAGEAYCVQKSPDTAG